MSIEQTKVIDGIGIDKTTDKIVLVITDHLNWTDNVGEHLLLLQEKINVYLSFVESGEILESYPQAKGKQVLINIVGKYPLGKEGQTFFGQAKQVLENAGFNLEFELFKSKN